MALDGITTSCIAHELKSTLLGSRIDKIHQPTKDEIRIHMRGTNGNCVLLISANPSHPRMHFTKTARENPMKAPLFCMVLRKHIAGGKIIDIVQPDFERILILKITATNEMGDPVVKNLILEIMGKHSNIILTEDTMEILDAIKRITYEKSSIREILPTRPYVFPPNQNKQNPLELENFSQFQEKLQTQKGQHLQEFILHSYMGISPVMANAICTGGNLSPALFCGELSEELEKRLYDSLLQTMRSVKETAFTPTMYYDAKTNAILDFSALPMLQFEDTQTYTKKI
ncbi:MAG: NFACT family protein, partial [Bacillota bacterium]